jgi:hypothetical protein
MERRWEMGDGGFEREGRKRRECKDEKGNE